ncbi:MAG: T9SS type A sorting domain-containing protein, partial [Sphaerochaetaceae bacterium]|nr:T9SS type A sorting domain-containing protein [Sphaerochaetaceae bacterium]
VSGSQGSSWNDRIVDLSPFKGVVKLIFRGKVGSNYTSDIAIDDVIIYDAQPVGLADKSGFKESNWSVYPNPSNGSFTISGLNLNTTLNIYNSLGEVVYQSQALSEKQVLRIEHLSEGLYFIEAIDDGKERSVKRLVVHR